MTSGFVQWWSEGSPGCPHSRSLDFNAGICRQCFFFAIFDIVNQAIHCLGEFSWRVGIMFFFFYSGTLITGWWFGTCFIFPYIGNVIIPTDFHIFQRGRSTTNQIIIDLGPIGSMYGIYANIGGILMANVTIYSIHGSYGGWSGSKLQGLPVRPGIVPKRLQGSDLEIHHVVSPGDCCRGMSATGTQC